MNTQINTVVQNALVLWLFRQRFPSDIECDVYCPDNSSEPQITFSCYSADVTAIFGKDGWEQQPAYRSQDHDYCKTLHGVRLVIRSAETAPEPQPEGPIRFVPQPNDSPFLLPSDQNQNPAQA